MSGILVNIAKVANGEVENAQAIIAAQDADRKGFASFELGNFFNSSVPVLKNYSEFEVNGSLARFQAGDETVKYLGNNVGDTLEDATSAPRNVQLYLCILPYTANTFEFVVRGGIAVAYDNAFGGIYENGTTTRIIGGCIFNGTSWINKWVINNPELLMTGVNPLLKMYADGLEGIFRKLICYNPNIVDTPISNYVPTSAVAASGIIPEVLNIDYPCVINVWVHYATTPLFKLFPDGCGSGSGTNTKALIGGRDVLSIGLLRQHTDGAWMTFGAPVIMRGLNSTYNNKSVQIPVPSPGKYKLFIESGFDTIVTCWSSSAPTITTYACGIGQISASVSSVFGSTVDY